MGRLAPLLASVACGFARAATGLTEEYVRGNAPALFADFQRAWRKSYAPGERAGRYATFVDNMLRAARLEQANPRATFGASKFADLSAAEFAPRHRLLRPPPPGAPAAPAFSAAEAAAALASSVDWRVKGAVTQVKDQGQCGSCWAFSTTGGIEGAWFVAGHSLTAVSEQQLVSCDTVDSGCGGGLMPFAVEWLVAARGGEIVTEAAYPYVSGDGNSTACHSVAGMPVGAVVSGTSGDIAHDEAQMAARVAARGPLPVAVDASAHWQLYTGGVVTGCNTTTLDHGVLIVGYTPEYWIVKNSWGAGWGEAGYIRLAYGSDQCGLTQSPTAPIVADRR